MILLGIFILLIISNYQILERFINAGLEYKQANIFYEGLSINQNRELHKTEMIFTYEDYIDNISCFRIPSVITYNNKIIVFAEARIYSCADCSITGIVSKVSYDGINFNKMQWVVYPTDRIGNFVPLLDNNKIIAQYSLGGHYKNGYWDCAPALENREIVSYNFGKTWSEFGNISGLGKYKGLQAGPGNSAIIVNNSYLFAAHYLTAYRNNGGVVLYKSDNLGKLYKPIHFFPNMDEPSIINMGNGTLFLNMRTNYGFRGISWSNNNGITWNYVYLDNNLIDPICEGGLAYINNTILFTNPNMKYARSNLTLAFKNHLNNDWNKIQITDSTVLSDYSVIGQNVININNSNYIPVIWGSCVLPFPFRPWCLWGWEIKISYIKYDLIVD